MVDYELLLRFQAHRQQALPYTNTASISLLLAIGVIGKKKKSL
jgi:hypothetical protein